MNKTIAEVMDQLRETGKVVIPGFGTFRTAVQKGREGVSKLGGTEKHWKTEDKVVVRYSQSDKFDSSNFPVK